MKKTMRPLSAASYSLLMRLQCPMLAIQTSDPTEQLKAATLWHFVHTADIDLLESATDAELEYAYKKHGYTIQFNEYPTIFKTMTRDIERMQSAFVESEPPGGKSPLAATIPTSQTSESL